VIDRGLEYPREVSQVADIIQTERLDVHPETVDAMSN
jgi:hypothetical protein